jgi:predicted O-methyltransferase YrrM
MSDEFESDIQGYMPLHELEVLRGFARGKRVLEIGTWKGRSAIGMAGVALEVWTCDHFRGDQYAGIGFTLPEFVANLEAAAVRKRVIAIVGDWRRIIAALNVQHFDVLHYDADHDYQPTKDFLDEVLWRLKPGAVVLVHDHSEAYPQVCQAVADAIAGTRFGVRSIYSVGIIEER